MKNKIIFLFLLISVSFASHAGSDAVNEYKKLYIEILQKLPQEMALPDNGILFKARLLDLFSKTSYSSIPSVEFNGALVSAINTRGNHPTVVISESSWKSLDHESKTLLILHEQVSLYGINDIDYQNSQIVYFRVKNGLSTSADYLMNKIASCNKDFFKSLSPADLEHSLETHQIKMSLYVSIYNNCVDYIRLWTQWNWSVSRIAPDAFNFLNKSPLSDSQKSEIKSALDTNKVKSFLTPNLNGGDGGGQETNGGDGVIAEMLMIFREIKFLMPEKLEVLAEKILKKSDVHISSIPPVTEWNNFSQNKKRVTVLEFILKDRKLPFEQVNSIMERIYNGKLRSREETLKRITQCDKDFLNELTKRDLNLVFLDHEQVEILTTSSKLLCTPFISLWKSWGMSTDLCPSPLNEILKSGYLNPSQALLSLRAIIGPSNRELLTCLGDESRCELVEREFNGNIQGEMKKLLKCAIF